MTACEARDEPIGEPTCIVRPDDGASIVQQEYRQYGCTPVPPRVAAVLAGGFQLHTDGHRGAGDRDLHCM